MPLVGIPRNVVVRVLKETIVFRKCVSKQNGDFAALCRDITWNPRVVGIISTPGKPIPRTMLMSLYGDMDISKIIEKPAKRKKIITLSNLTLSN